MKYVPNGNNNFFFNQFLDELIYNPFLLLQSNSKEANIVQKDNKSMEVIEKKEVPTAKV